MVAYPLVSIVPFTSPRSRSSSPTVQAPRSRSPSPAPSVSNAIVPYQPRTNTNQVGTGGQWYSQQRNPGNSEIAALLRELVNSDREKRERKREIEDRKAEEELVERAKEEERKKMEDEEKKEADREARMAKLFAEQIAAMEKKREDEAGFRRDPTKGKEKSSAPEGDVKKKDGSLKIGDADTKKRGQEVLQGGSPVLPDAGRQKLQTEALLGPLDAGLLHINFNTFQRNQETMLLRMIDAIEKLGKTSAPQASLPSSQTAPPPPHPPPAPSVQPQPSAAAPHDSRPGCSFPPPRQIYSTPPHGHPPANNPPRQQSCRDPPTQPSNVPPPNPPSPTPPSANRVPPPPAPPSRPTTRAHMNEVGPSTTHGDGAMGNTSGTPATTTPSSSRPTGRLAEVFASVAGHARRVSGSFFAARTTNLEFDRVREGKKVVVAPSGPDGRKQYLAGMKKELTKEYKADLEVLCRKDNIKYVNKKQAVN
ncbi:hypothetical protein CBR_g66771 [Chara braunii]|uniref:Uncharacterized protein n=1 Tax=Chara braunii TaxID=69332 RepID=A0A388K9A7_CHABU|nr:hypothetical protein CBR_g66771 [Chara braunii]|eukprot:GBG66635.1 hypothetical protein CBR_g66771 [Chara braunii]